MKFNQLYKNIICRVFFVALFTFFVSTGAFAQEPNAEIFTLNTALRHAYMDNPTLMIAREELKITSEKLPQALSGWRPTVVSELSLTTSDIDGSNFASGGDGSTAKDIDVSVSQPLFRGGKTLAETKSARQIIKAQNALLRKAEQNVLLGAAIAYMDVLRDTALLGLSENNHEVIASRADATENRFEVGELTRTDVSQAQARLADAQANIITAQGSLRSSHAVLERFVGVVSGLLQKPKNVSLELPETLEEAIAIADQASPDVLVSSFVHQASEKDIGSVFAELLPTVGLFGSWNKTFDPAPGTIPEQTTKLLGITASIPLYSAGGTRSRVREAKYNASKRYLETLEVRRQVKEDVIRSWESWQTAISEIKARHAQVDASTVAQEGVKQEAELGARTTLDSLDADQELLDAQVSLITAERNEIVARFSLAANLGYLTPETLGFSSVVADFSR